MTLRALSTSLAITSMLALCGAAAVADSGKEPSPPFSEDFLKTQSNIQLGEEIWKEQCRHCHGRSAYPGKAPKLKPRRYKPDFVYDRVTNGFRKMPAWKEVYDQQERMSIVAYILSKDFSP
ncbi:MAG: cytochrome c [Kiloniellales bacterium]|nr:cytochrome c [Kiloniellales bacterium]